MVDCKVKKVDYFTIYNYTSMGDFKISVQSLLYWTKLFNLQNPFTGLQYNPHSSLWQLPNVLVNPVFRIKHLHCWAVWLLGSLQWKLLQLWLWLHFRIAVELLYRYQTEGEEFLKRIVALDDTRFWALIEAIVTIEEAPLKWPEGSDSSTVKVFYPEYRICQKFGSWHKEEWGLYWRPVKEFCKINNFFQYKKDCAELLKSPSYVSTVLYTNLSSFASEPFSTIHFTMSSI